MTSAACLACAVFVSAPFALAREGADACAWTLEVLGA